MLLLKNKLYAPVATVSTQDNANLLQQLMLCDVMLWSIDKTFLINKLKMIWEYMVTFERLQLVKEKITQLVV